MIKLSIIIPIYRVEQYLHKCVDSVLRQDLPSTEYEIILVDDGSPDNCPQICDEYATDHDNIRVVHRENGGLSAARNTGIEIANGGYIMFVDSDDYIEPNVLGRLLAQVVQDDLDVLRYKHQYVRVKNERVSELGNEREYEVYNPYKSGSYKGHDYSSKVIDGLTFLNTRFGTSCYAWAFIVKRELLDGCLFTPGIYFEDTDWTPRMLVKAKRVASTDTIVYNYMLTRQGSITNAVNRSKQKKVLDDKMRLIGEMQRQAEELKSKGLNNTWFSRMIADTVISVIGILSVDFYVERKAYLEQLKAMNIYPLQSKSPKAKLINFSPRLAVEILHVKNSK